jgi:hypothetical protein
MPSWWYSIEFLGRAKSFLGWATLLGLFVAAMYTVVNLRLDALRAEHAKPRILTEQQHSTLVNRLSKTAAGVIWVTSVQGDEEPFNFAQQLNEALKASGWDSNYIGVTMYPIIPKGLVILVRSPDTLPLYFAELVDTLAKIGLSPQPQFNGNESAGVAKIVVGQKP